MVKRFMYIFFCFIMISSAYALSAEDIFKDLKYNNPDGKSVFSMNTEVQILNPDILKLSFNEVCGEVIDYQLFVLGTCSDTVYTDVYGQTEVYNNKNKTWVNITTIIDTVETTRVWDCKKSITDKPIGISDIYIDATIKNEICDDGSYGHKIDWIPDFSGITYPKWAWWNDTYDYCRNIVLEAAGSEISDETIYIELDYDSDMRSNYFDVRFVNESCFDNGTLLSHEFTNKTPLKADTFVKIPTIYTSQFNISVYYGDASVGNGEDVTGTWNDKYRLVWHKDEGSGVIVDDSTANNNDGTTNADWGFSGIVDFELEYTAGNSDKTDSGNIGSVMNTLYFWADYNRATTDASSCNVAIGTMGSNAWTGTGGCTGLLLNEIVVIQTDSGDIQGWTATDLGTATLPDGYQNYVFVWNNAASAYNLYYNGYNKGTGNKAGTIDKIPNGIISAARHNAFYYSNHVDEIRPTAKNMTADEIEYLYQNMVNQSTYVTIADEQPRITPITYDSPPGVDISPEQSFSFADSDYVPLFSRSIDITNLNETNVISFFSNIQKTVTASSSDVYLNISDEGITIREVLLRTVQNLDDIGSVSDFFMIDLPLGYHNFTFSMRRTGVGTVTASNIDVVIFQPVTIEQHSLNPFYFNFSTSFNNATFQDLTRFQVNKTTSSGTYYMARDNMTASGADTTDQRIYNIEELTSSSIATRYISGASDIGNVFFNWLETEPESTHNHTIQGRNSGGQTISKTIDIFYMDLLDSSGDILNAVNTTNQSTTRSSFIDITDQTNITSTSITIQNGTAIYIMSFISIGSISGSQTVNMTIITDSGCSNFKSRYISSNNDIGLISSAFLCTGLSEDDTDNITMIIDVPSGETGRIYDEHIGVFEIQNISFTIQDVPPIFVTQPENMVVPISSEDTQTITFFSDINVSVFSSCPQLNTTVNNISSTVFINATFVPSLNGTSISCNITLDDGIFNSTSNQFTVSYSAITPEIDFTLVQGCTAQTTPQAILLVTFSVLVAALAIVGIILKSKIPAYNILIAIVTIFFANNVWTCFRFASVLYITLGIVCLLSSWFD